MIIKRRSFVKTFCSVLAAIGSFSMVTEMAHAMASGTIQVDPNTPPQLGQPFNFIITTDGLHGNQNPRVEVDAYQDVPFDYIDNNGVVHTQTDPLVYSEALDVSQLPVNPLGGIASVWLWHGGSAHCKALLYYWDNHPSQHQVILAEIEFDAAG